MKTTIAFNTRLVIDVLSTRFLHQYRLPAFSYHVGSLHGDRDFSSFFNDALQSRSTARPDTDPFRPQKPTRFTGSPSLYTFSRSPSYYCYHLFLYKKKIYLKKYHFITITTKLLSSFLLILLFSSML